MADFLNAWNTLSSEGLVGSLLGFLSTAAEWAGAASALLGLVL